MYGVSELMTTAQEALLLSVALSLPAIGAAALVGLVVALLQSVTQIHDTTLAHLPRLLAVVFVLILSGSWIGGQVSAFALRVFSGG